MVRPRKRPKRKLCDLMPSEAINAHSVEDIDLAPIAGAYVEVPTSSNGGTGDPRKELTDRGLGALEAMAAASMPLRLIAARLGMYHQTLTEIRRRQPAAEEAFQRGRAGEEFLLVSLLRRRAVEKNCPIIPRSPN